MIKSWMELIGDALLIASGLAFLLILLLILLNGYFYVVENLPWALWAEIVMALAIVGIGTERLINDVRRWKK